MARDHYPGLWWVKCCSHGELLVISSNLQINILVFSLHVIKICIFRIRSSISEQVEQVSIVYSTERLIGTSNQLLEDEGRGAY